MANLTITQLPAAGPITGTESVPIVQNGQTVRTTTAAIAASPAQTQTFLTKVQEPTLPNSRYLSTGSGLGLTDGGAQSYLRLEFTGAAASLETVSPGVLVKTGATTIANRTLTTSGAGLSVTNGDGIAGDPTFALTGLAQALANASGTGMLAVVGGTTIAGRQIFGTSTQIVVANGNGSGDPTIALATDPVLPGTGAVTVPKGTTVQQPVGADGQIRFNTDTSTFDGYSGGSWKQFTQTGGVTTFSAGSTGFTPSSPTVGPVTLGGVLNVSSGGTGVSTLTGYVRGNGTSAMTASPTVPTTDLSGTVSNAQLANSSVTYNGVNVALGASGTITATATNPLTIGTGLTGTSYDGSSPVTIAIDSTVATLAGTQTLTNKSMSGATNTFSSIPNGALSNSTISGVALGSNLNALTIGTGLSGSSYNGSGAVTIAIDSTVATLSGSQTFTNKSISGSTNTLTDIPNSALSNSSITLGSTSVALGASSATLSGLTSVTVTQDPTAPLQLATKQYVDAVTEGLNVHASCSAATPASLATLTGGTVTYNNGSSGVGATLTLSVALTTLDGYTLLNGNRILVKNESNQAYNGIYTWATGGTVLTRATDFDTTTEVASGDYTFVTFGTLYANTGWVQTNPTTAIGTSPINFVQFSGAGTYTAGTGLTLTGTQFSITNTGVSASTYGSASSVPTIAVNAQGQITSASDTAIAINGNQITSGTVGSAYITGSYTGITGVGTLTTGTWNATTIGVGYGGTGLASYATGDLLYASGSTTLSKLALGTTNFVLTAGSSAPQYVAQSTLSVGSATNATNASNVAISTNSTNADYFLTVVSTSTGNLPEFVATGLTANPSTGKITGGVSGGTF